MSSYKVRKTKGDTEWFVESRFGMFIHFGLYSLPARHEWVKTNERISEEKYDKYFKYFDPDMLDMKKWAKQAKEAGMKYAVLTSKHHEGFCLFDSNYTDYKSTNTPYKKDIVKEFVEAFRAEGLKVGLYYSLLDWHHPDFPIDALHPRRLDENAEELDKGRDMKVYAEYMRNQIRELLTNYGKIDILWLDFSYSALEDDKNVKDWMQFGGVKGKSEWESEKLISLARKLQPGIIIDNRAETDEDIWTPEQCEVKEWVKHPKTNELVTWELCQTFSGSWGYHRDGTSWKSGKELIDLLINSVSYGGNLLLNVGPTARGYFDKRAEKALSEIAEWMKYNSRSIYGCTMAKPKFSAPEGTRLTQSRDEKRLYIHLSEYKSGKLRTNFDISDILYAQFLHDGSEIICSPSENGEVIFDIPELKPDVCTPVIEVFLK